MERVLLIEDDTLVSGIIEYYLKQSEIYEVVRSATGGEALALARDHFDVILMDIMLPDANGIQLCQLLRKWHSCPIIFISCLDDSTTIIDALEKGGDDFLTKPFDNAVLHAKIQANLRRWHKSQPDVKTENQLSCKAFILDAQTHQLQMTDGRTERLSDMEYRILSYLMANAGKRYTPKELYRRIWGTDSLGDSRTVLVHIHNIRKKIEADSNTPAYLKMEWGKGYYFDPDGEAPSNSQ